ncbi:Phosphoethanolamine N-methyltransferase [Auxenochlorella protothecoides]|uniref:phosphoethanolamine N-methyltransferase n=1 Tax=Auxenochlorella protothecoides TaxID=3075 RepID=A0A087SMR6_AUXPR|nr:Phosphoethanolamine N-methyltransferase [Auxenochlorella protothecoides]KFM27020.1 Phosphoethanolamine N-methyltransferase [Auxenochlorella protothecoides]
MGTPQEREAQKSYWAEHSSNATVESMMLDSQAADIDKLERPEVLKLLGSVDGLDVVELGAGIGRFTRPLAEEARSVVALDFMPNLIEQNRVDNGHLGNIDFRCGDATELDLPAGCADLVFSNWLLMYLADDEVAKLAHNMLTWVKVGGTVFFRESCFRQSGDKARGSNPTHYRNPREYFKIFDECEVVQPDGRVAVFDLVCCKSVDTYVRVKQNQNQVCWKWRKIIKPAPTAFRVDRHFLDGQRYTAGSIARYEFVFGQGFISPGGERLTQELAARLGLNPDAHVLDVGCGVGGSAFHLARTLGCYVYGIDLSANMILTALERAAASGNGDKASRRLGGMEGGVSLEVSDATRRALPEASFDAVFTRDSLLHIHDKPALFSRLLRALRPGGQLLVTDYCRGGGPPSPGFSAYIDDRGYDLVAVAEYAALLSAAGFEVLSARDETPRFVATLGAELERLRERRDEFVARFSEREHADMVAGWEAKLERAHAGEHCWGVFHARRP